MCEICCEHAGVCSIRTSPDPLEGTLIGHRASHPLRGHQVSCTMAYAGYLVLLKVDCSLRDGQSFSGYNIKLRQGDI